MSSASKFVALALLAGCAAAAMAQSQPELRVCADPNNLPYSNQQQQGFENRIAEMLGRDLGRPVTYFWLRQGGKFFRRTLNSGVCDVVMSVPVGLDDAAATRPYYSSSYVFVTRRDRGLRISGFDDPQLRMLKIGVHVLGEQDDSVPPVHAFTTRGIVKNLVGYSIFGNLNEDNPAADLLQAVTRGDVDVAVAWGPLAGYFARNSSVPLELTPIAGDSRNPSLPFRYDIAMGVRHGDDQLRDALNAEIDRRHAEIASILRNYGVSQLTPSQSAPAVEKGE